MARYGDDLARWSEPLHEPGWTGGGFYSGADYRTEGYRVRRTEPRSYGADYARPRRSGGYDAPYTGRELGSRTRARDPRSYAADFQSFGQNLKGAVPDRYAVDYYGGRFGPAYYSGGYFGRQLGRGQGRRGDRGS